MRPAAVASFMVLVPFAVGCHETVDLGVEPFLWRADHETADFSQWTEGGTGGTFISKDGTLAIVEDPVHGGRYAVKSSIAGSSNLTYARLYRQDDLPVEAYYSAWFYLPAQYAVGQFWSVFEFGGRWDPSNTNTATAVWSLDLRQTSPTQLMWYVWDGARGQELKPSQPVAAPIGRWIRVLAFVRQATDQTGRVAFWIDDQPFIDENNVSTVPTKWMSWTVGSVAGRMPENADLYIDDAAIWRAGN